MSYDKWAGDLADSIRKRAPDVEVLAREGCINWVYVGTFLGNKVWACKLGEDKCSCKKELDKTI